jgi:hypothetical protein
MLLIVTSGPLCNVVAVGGVFPELFRSTPERARLLVHVDGDLVDQQGCFKKREVGASRFLSIDIARTIGEQMVLAQRTWSVKCLPVSTT